MDLKRIHYHAIRQDKACIHYLRWRAWLELKAKGASAPLCDAVKATINGSHARKLLAVTFAHRLLMTSHPGKHDGINSCFAVAADRYGYTDASAVRKAAKKYAPDDFGYTSTEVAETVN